ncbi:MAG: hypothetical protein ABJA86_11845 [Nocardioidaceae bacterium]
MSWSKGLLVGAAAGAAGTIALNAITYLDMALQGRATSSTPEHTVEKVAEKAHLPIPGDDETRDNRISGLGPLLGIAAGVGVGAALGLFQSSGWRPSFHATSVAAAAGAMVAGNAPMSLLGITDPREWSAVDWASAVIPHIAYGAVTAYVLESAGRP